jgi:hypothetical protein
MASEASAPVTGPSLTDRALARREMHAAAGVKTSERNVPAPTVAALIGHGRKDRALARRKTRAALAAKASVQTVRVSTVAGQNGTAPKDRALAPPETHAATGAKANGQNGPASIAAGPTGPGRKDHASARREMHAVKASVLSGSVPSGHAPMRRVRVHQEMRARHGPRVIAPNGRVSIAAAAMRPKATRPASWVGRRPPPAVRPIRTPATPLRKGQMNHSASPSCWRVQASLPGVRLSG